MADANKPPRVRAKALNPDLWQARGQLRDEVVQDIAARLLRGQRPAAIGPAVGMSERAGREKCKVIASALGIPLAKERYSLAVAGVIRRAEAGESREEIARALNMKLESVSRILRANGFCEQRVRLTKEESKAVVQSLSEGALARDVAAKFDLPAGLVMQRRRRLAAKLATELPTVEASCLCGMRHGHTGRCRKFTPSIKAIFRERLIAGEFAAVIARDLEVATRSPFITQLLEQLRKEGHRCRCGAPIGHPLGCPERPKGRKTAAPTKFELGVIRAVIESGSGTRHAASDLLGRELSTKHFWNCRAQLAKEGVKCRCGLPINHRKSGVCSSVASRTLHSAVPRLEDRKVHRAVWRRYRQGAGIKRTSAETGASAYVVAKLFDHWRATSTVPVSPCKCGRPAHHPGGCSENTPGALNHREKKQIADLIRSGTPPHKVAEIIGVDVRAVFKHSAALRKQLFDDGVACACGRPLGHPYWCSAKWDQFERPRLRDLLAKAKENAVRSQLLRGLSVDEIRSTTGISYSLFWALRAELSPEDKRVRSAAIVKRTRKPALSADVVGLVEDAVPRHLDTALRADVMGELHLALAEGRIEADQIQSAVNSFVRRGLSQWQSAYGPTSLDAPVSGEDDRRMIDLIRDDTTTSLVDEIDLGQ